MISVIIPYYNPDGRADTEQLLYRAVQSVLDSLDGFCQYQVIVVDDGSFRIATGLPAHFSGKPVHLECARHGCLGAARNRGLELADGNLVSFLDADDIYVPETFRQCVGKMESVFSHGEEKAPQVLAFRHQDFYNGSVPTGQVSGKADVGFSTMMTGDSYMHDGNLFASSCMYIFSKDFLTRNGLRFVEGQTAEDEEFTPRMLLLCQRMIVTESTVYGYCRREGSISHTETPQKLASRIRNAGLALKSLEAFRESHLDTPHRGLDRKIAMLRLDILRLRLRRILSYFK